MKNVRSILVFWALLLVPTLMIAVTAFNLLSHEQERINNARLDALTRNAGAVSQTIHVTVEAVKDNISRNLLELDPAELEQDLMALVQINPLVRNVFIYKDKKLIYPDRGMASTREERQFISRYDSLFSGTLGFDFNRIPERERLSQIGASGRTAEGSYFSGKAETDRFMSSRKLVDLSKLPQKSPEKKQAAEADLETGRKVVNDSGWIPWFSQNRLHILCWAKKTEKGPVYGIELELMTLLSRLILDFPEIPEKGTALALLDGNHNFIHLSGTIDVEEKQKPAVTMPVSYLLPHWQVGVFTDQDIIGTARGFFYVSLLLLGTFIVSILSGGMLLTRLALNKIKDARQKTSFVSSVSHELKTPLTSIRMYAELLLSKRVTDEGRIKTYLSIIVDESSRLSRLINNVLDFGRLEQGKKRYDFSVVELDLFLENIIETHRIRMTRKNLEPIVEMTGRDFTLTTDKDALEQVVLNILDNALKYAGNGRFIKFILLRDAGSAILKICDNGPGIPETLREKIFEKFFRIDNSLTSEQTGSGLGLSIARQIMADLGGGLDVEPDPSGGSCFILTIKDHADKSDGKD